MGARTWPPWPWIAGAHHGPCGHVHKLERYLQVVLTGTNATPHAGAAQHAADLRKGKQALKVQQAHPAANCT